MLGASHELVASLAPKSVTSPIAMGLAEQLGGAPFLTAALVIATGVYGAMILSPLMRLLRIKDPAAIGMAAGARLAWRRRRPRLSYRFDRRRFRRNSHGTQRRADQRDPADSAALAGPVRAVRRPLRQDAAKCKIFLTVY